MVTRKPLPKEAAVEPIVPPQLQMQNIRQELWSATDSEASGDRIWEDASTANAGQPSRETAAPSEDIPRSLHPGGPADYSTLETERNVWDEPGNTATTPRNSSHEALDVASVPAVLRPGGAVNRSETNPFKRKPRGGASQSSVAPPPALPSNTVAAPTTSAFPPLVANETGTNPWQPALDEKRLDSEPLIPSVLEPEQPRDAWDSDKPSRQPSPGVSVSPALVSVPSEEGSAGWDEERSKATPSPLFSLPPPNEEVLEDSHAWDDLGNLDKGKAAVRVPPVSTEGSAGPIDDWNLIDVDGPSPAPPSRQDTWENFDNPEDGKAASTPQKPQETVDQAPAQSAPEPRRPPRRPVTNGPAENYQIKNITWYDVNAAKNPRTSPILVQNANGPCPLVALVNALTLTTPAETKTALVETLRSREQVSLSLLLDAVFDELMSSRRNNPDFELPDVAELYEFLQGLHTGMNVNPRFIPTPEVITAMKRTSLSHLHPSEREDVIPGSFEDTKEMKLYATFSIPLIHGWIPATTDAAYGALARQAASYEDAQNLLFREEELEEKLSNSSQQGLTEEEQEVYQDILTIKSFLSISATQLTPGGIDVIRKAMNPGSVAILFRNDHFSTLYRHPQTLELLTLVTDAGYAAHAEVVWESLVDVNGEHAEFFSGDFRLVGGASHNQQEPQFVSNAPSSSSGGDNWTTVQGRRGRNQQQRSNTAADGEPPLSPKYEQEDRDLALALQLQEEEDERHRAEQARRQRESRLSEQFIEQQALQPGGGPGLGRGGSQGGGRGGGGRGGLGLGAQSAPNRRSSSTINSPGITTNTGQIRGGGTPPRGRGNSAGSGRQQNVRSLIPPPRNPPAVSRPADEGLDDAPPSYEQAAKQTAYVPPEGHPSHPGSTGRGSGSGSSASTSRTSVVSPQPQRQQQNAQRRAQYPGAAAGQGRYRTSAAAGSVDASRRDKDCVVM